MRNLVFLTCHTLQVFISDFQISGQSFTHEDCHNSRTSHDTDMKFGPVIKLDKINNKMSKKFSDDIISANCNIIVFFPIYC